MRSKDYIPASDPKFIEFGENLFDKAGLHHEDWGVPSAEQVIGGALIEFKDKYAKAIQPNRGKIDVSEKNAARKVAEKAIRSYVQGFLAKNPLITDTEREMLKINVYDTTPTTISAPLGQANAKVDYLGQLQLQLRIFHVENTPIDPKANYGFRIYFGIYADSDTPPANGMELRESRFTRQKKMLFTFLPTDAKKTVYFSIRYENSKGEAGTWGPLFSAVIP